MKQESKLLTTLNETPGLIVSEEIINTFTVELAHTAYISISRLNSGYF